MSSVCCLHPVFLISCVSGSSVQGYLHILLGDWAINGEAVESVGSCTMDLVSPLSQIS